MQTDGVKVSKMKLKVANKKAVKTKPVATPKKADKLDALIADLNKKLGVEGKVYRGADIRALEADRISTGILGIDYILNGGLPRGMFIQYKGAESCGKTTSLLQTAANLLKKNCNVGWLASEGFNKTWARQNGVLIPYDEQEIKQLCMKSKDPQVMKETLLDYNETCTGSFVLGITKTGDKLLDVAVEMLMSNQFDLLVIDSLSMLSNSKELEGEMGDDSYGGNAKMLNKFCRILTARFNELDSREEEGCRTAVVGIQQMRDKIGSYNAAPDATGGWGLKHTKVADVLFKRVEHLIYGDKEKRVVYGRKITATTTKCKIGPEGRVCEFDIYTVDWDGVKAGSVDIAREVLTLGIKFGLIDKAAAWVSIDDKRFQGLDAAAQYLRSNPEILEAYYKDVLDVAKS